ncbi:MAG TPA: universal stress protein [Streptosporangiaceae bacterium]|jgi:nucleotide-binding universal stress UspA family protein|nr:universal stress protein [Streptosporangiaceae bacterium]
MFAARNARPRLVAGVDGSSPSIEALRWAVEEARLSAGTVDAIIAWKPAIPTGAGDVGLSAAPGLEDIDYAELAAKTLNAAIAEVSLPPGVPVNQLVIEGNAGEVLLGAAQNADLLVLGHSGHGGIASALMGSVSIRCLHHACCPVVVVRGT